MATAYAALTYVMHIIDQIQRHPRPPISLHKQQIDSLMQTTSFLQEFLEAGYTGQVAYSSEADPMEMRIAEAAHAAEDVIESHIVNQILADVEQLSSLDLYESVQKVIDDMESVKKEAMDVKEKMQDHQYHIPGVDSSTFAGSLSSDGPEQYRTMVGFDDILIQVLGKLTSNEHSRQIISLTGMGGMGKSTLAKNVCQHQLVVQHFDFRAWLLVSQQYKIRELLLNVLEWGEENLSQVDECELGIILHQKLTDRRYLIIIDDIWNIEAWDELKLFLPENNNGSRILITTRLLNLARQIDDSHNIEMPMLDEVNSWKLFCKHVFKEEDCPHELQEIGKRIVKGCKGLPLSISVVGGLLAKSERTTQYWEEIAENISPTVNLENDKHCLQILYTSYSNLPVHLKPYFLFMGVILSEGFFYLDILMQFFIAEGFVKPISGKSLEQTALACVIELIERNLVLIDQTDKSEDWLLKSCAIHDLLRDLCLRESQKQNFIYIVGQQSLDYIPHKMDSIRRIFVARNTPKAEVFPFLESALLLRSLWWSDAADSLSLSSLGSRLFRHAILNEITCLEDLVHKVNLRVIRTENRHQCGSLSLISLCWNLQMFLIFWGSSDVLMAPCEIWTMPQLRYIVVPTTLCLVDPPRGETDGSIVLENLHTLGIVYNFRCSEETVKRIPCIKNLNIQYTEVEASYAADYCLNNLGRLQQLEYLTIKVEMQTHMMPNQNLNITFPLSLVRLTLTGTSLHWDDVTTKIGSLPSLRSLNLLRESCTGAEWETIEDKFCNLNDLKIAHCPNLEYWMTESSHFPRLKFLSLEGLGKLREIPSSLGDIPTLEKIKLVYCSETVYCSARRIQEEQAQLGNEDLHVQIFKY